MKLLLTSLGLTNDKIAKALSDLVGKEPKDTKIAYIPTGNNASRGDKGLLIDSLCQLRHYGFKVDIIEIIAFSNDALETALNDADVILFGGGNVFYLSYWAQKKGLFELLPRLLETKVYASISAGSIFAGNSFGLTSQVLEHVGELSEDEYQNLGPTGESSAKPLKLVDFIFKPHLNSAESAEHRTEEYVREAAKKVTEPVYALDDQSALKIVDGNVEVISEGRWLLLNS